MSEGTEAGADLVRRLGQSIPVKAAFWLKDSEEGSWYLYIASDQIEDKMAYGEVMRQADQMTGFQFDPFQVKLIPTSDPFAQAALKIYHRYPENIASGFIGGSFGGQGVEGVYLYPISITRPT